MREVERSREDAEAGARRGLREGDRLKSGEREEEGSRLHYKKLFSSLVSRKVGSSSY